VVATLIKRSFANFTARILLDKLSARVRSVLKRFLQGYAG
jgi:hypothetical protein